MLKRLFSAVTFILLSTSMLTMAFYIQPVKPSGTIIIRADGSIDPPTAPISSFDNITYTLAGNIDGSIMVERSNITVDGSGYIVHGSGDGCGFNLTGIINVTIKNTNIENFSYAINLSFSNLTTINRNNIINTSIVGIALGESATNNTVSNNNITANDDFGILAYSSSSNNIISDNNIADHWCGIWLEGSSYSVSGNNIQDNNFGIVLTGLYGNNTISGNNITANHVYGIELNRCSGNTIAGNVFVDDGLVAAWDSYGNVVVDNLVNNKPLVYLEGVSGVAVEVDAGQVILVNCGGITVEGLTLCYTAIGVELWNTNSTKISSNDISNNDYGILFGGSSSNNTVSNNTITANSDFGIALLESSGNKIYHNNFINNANHALEQPGYIYTNAWDDGYPSGGNYWNNYWDDYNATDLYKGPYQNETGSDGIRDTSFHVPFGNRDRYPLMHRYGSIQNLNTTLAYSTIQSAIDAPETLDGHTIFVETGAYYESVVVNKSLSISGENKDTTIIVGSPGDIVFRVESNNVRISGFTIQSALAVAGVLSNAQDVTISDNLVINGHNSGIQISNVSNTVSGNLIANCGTAILIYGSNHTIERNILLNNSFWAIQLSYFSNNNRVRWNVITDNRGDGIYVQLSDNNTISDNSLINNGYGISLSASRGNIIFHNHIINNTRQVFIDRGNTNNAWDDGYPSGGNYWSDYKGMDAYSGPYQNETGSDGIGDTPYAIDENNRDRYPLGVFGVHLLGDLNLDKTVDISDAILASSAFGSYPGHPNWNEQADLNKDGIVDIFDIIILASNFGKTA